jgi:diguanylate cyclase (GGDEF)-like protein
MPTFLFVRTVTFVAAIAAVVLLGASIGLGFRGLHEKRTATDLALSNKADAASTQIDEYFARARSIMLITSHNPAYRDFYTAPGSRLAKVEARGPAIRRAEDGLAFLERIYPNSIGEACFIDRSGPENARYVMGKRAPPDDLSPDESANPFFAPTFALTVGNVFQAEPYVSPDTHEWVISNSTPVPGTGYPAAAIVHFEVTLESFRRTAASIAKDDEIVVADARTGKVLIDSRFVQRVGAPLGRPKDRRFSDLAAVNETTGTATMKRHRSAFRRLAPTPNNANDWVVVAVAGNPTGSVFQEAGWAPLGMAASALVLLLLAAGSYRSAKRAREEEDRLREDDERRRVADREYHETQREFTEILQITRDEGEAYELLRRYLERSVTGSSVLVLNRNNSRDRLEPMTDLEEHSPLADKLKVAEPDSCLAVRLGRTHERTNDRAPLLACEICGVVASNSTCVPSLVGGEVIGSVLVEHDEPLDDASKHRIEESISQASPVLANLRNLALSQARALTDGLTGLPNRRSIDDTLKRLAAHADRTSRPLGAVLLDLDHFKKINDLCGHEKGDEVLAAVGSVISTTSRVSDFSGRYGGEEFIVLLPDTDRDASVMVAEKLRSAIAAIDVPGVSLPITASFGVAAMPADAHEPALLMRAADRSLYVAKAKGRNRVETLAPGSEQLVAI